jgi:hypothetical protein
MLSVKDERLMAEATSLFNARQQRQRLQGQLLYVVQAALFSAFLWLNG